MIILQIIVFLILAILAGILYRMGGSDKYDTKWRDLGVPITVLLGIWNIGLWHWSLLLCYPIMFGAMTTYWKILNPIFGDTKEDAHWYNWIAHGLGIGLALIPYGIFTNTLVTVMCRSLALGLAMMVWSELNDNAVWEENGRGQACIWTLLLLLCK